MYCVSPKKKSFAFRLFEHIDMNHRAMSYYFSFIRHPVKAVGNTIWKQKHSIQFYVQSNRPLNADLDEDTL